MVRVPVETRPSLEESIELWPSDVPLGLGRAGCGHQVLTSPSCSAASRVVQGGNYVRRAAAPELGLFESERYPTIGATRPNEGGAFPQLAKLATQRPEPFTAAQRQSAVRGSTSVRPSRLLEVPTAIAKATWIAHSDPRYLTVGKLLCLTIKYLVFPSRVGNACGGGPPRTLCRREAMGPANRQIPWKLLRFPLVNTSHLYHRPCSAFQALVWK